MNKAEEDALIEQSIYDASSSASVNWRQAIRLAIRAAYAQGREDAAKDIRPLPCDVKVHNTLFRAGVESWAVYAAIERQREYGPTEEAFCIAAAIRRGK